MMKASLFFIFSLALSCGGALKWKGRYSRGANDDSNARSASAAADAAANAAAKRGLNDEEAAIASPLDVLVRAVDEAGNSDSTDLPKPSQPTPTPTHDPDWYDNNCEEVCAKKKEIAPPLPKDDCDWYAPEYNKTCNCIVAYRCCKKTCPPVVGANCKPGESYKHETTDCCRCKTEECIACPTPDPPMCNPACERLVFSKDYNKCTTPKCQRICPEQQPPDCGPCMKAESYHNGTFCNCEQWRCVQRKCQAIPLAPKQCHKIDESVDVCGCLQKQYNREKFCERTNQKAKELRCDDPLLPDSCLQKVVRKDKCGCDDPECIQKAETCQQKFDLDAGCPRGHYPSSGLTPCGQDRDICLKCAEPNFEEECDKNCSKVVSEKDVFGCTVQRCIPNICRAITPECKYCEQIMMKYDACGCPVASCVPRCSDIDEADCPGGPNFAMVHKDVCGCQRVVCLSHPRQLETMYIGTFSIEKREMSWEEAENFCGARGGYLAIIGGLTEENAIRRIPYFDPKLSYWIGATCEKKGTENYYWMFEGKKFSFKDAPYPCSRIRQNIVTEPGCESDWMGVRLTGAEGWTKYDVEVDADGFICEYPTREDGNEMMKKKKR